MCGGGGRYAYICVALAKRCVLTIVGKKGRSTIKNTLTAAAAAAAAATTTTTTTTTTSNSVWKQSVVKGKQQSRQTCGQRNRLKWLGRPELLRA